MCNDVKKCRACIASAIQFFYGSQFSKSSLDLHATHACRCISSKSFGLDQYVSGSHKMNVASTITCLANFNQNDTAGT